MLNLAEFGIWLILTAWCIRLSRLVRFQQSIINEQNSRLALRPATPSAPSTPSAMAGDVISALTNLGYSLRSSRDAVALALQGIHPETDFDGLFRASLKELK